MGWSDEYPHELYANALLLDGKIECWKTGNINAENEGMWPFKTPWKLNRSADYKWESKTWVVNNDDEHNNVFTTLSKDWYKQWKHADDYKLGKAYSENDGHCHNIHCYWNYEGLCCPEDEESFNNASPDQLDCPSSLRKDFEEQLNNIYDECVSLLSQRNMRELGQIKKFILSQRS